LFQISELAQGYTDSLTGILQVYLSMSSNRTGEVVKALTLITILSTPATIIASWYGMNFKHDMHELDWTHGYAFAFGITAFTTLITYWYLRRRNWF
jgi:magnesium transporter